MVRLKAGAAFADITPKCPHFLYGYPFAERTSVGVNDRLLSSSLYLADGRESVMFITNDIIYVNKSIVSNVRKAVSQATRIPESRIMIGATHTHSGPVTVDCAVSANDPVVPRADPEYIRYLEQQIIRSACEAFHHAVPAKIGLTVADGTGIGTNRHDPDGPADLNIPVLAVKTPDGEWIACMMVCNMHPTVLHEDSTLYSGDFPAFAREILQKKILGCECPVLYFTGAAGNQSPRHVTKSNTFEEAARIGGIIAGAIRKKVDAGIEFFASPGISCRSELIDLPRRDFPTVEWAMSNRDKAFDRFYSLKKSSGSAQEIRTAEVDWFGAEELLFLSAQAAKGALEEAYRASLPAEIQIVRIGAWTFVSWPGEVFVEYALELKSKFADTFLITLTNGELQGYITTEKAGGENCYEASNSLFHHSSGKVLLAKTIEMLRKPDPDPPPHGGESGWYFLGIDLGTSYFKAGIFDGAGHLMGLGRRYVHQRTDGTTCELPVDIFWKTIRNCLDEAVQTAGIPASAIKSLSCSSQVNSFILLDKYNHPLTPLILWPDRRAAGMELPVGDTDELMKRTGLGIIPDTQFAVAKISWFRKHQPDIWKKTASILSISDFLTFSLTGKKACDYSTASMSGLFDVADCSWWNEQLENIGIHADMLPLPRRTGAYVGPILPNTMQLTGLSTGIPFFLGGPDHHMAAVGSGIPSGGGRISESTGTVLSCVAYADRYLPAKNVCTAPGLSAGHFFRMMFDENGAASLEWYQKRYAPEHTLPELLEMAEHVEPGCDGLTALPCADAHPGLSGFRHSRDIRYRHGHYVRALLESTAYSLQRMVAEMNRGRAVPAVVSTGGGSRSELWVNIKSGILKTPFLIPECTESACMGAAMMGALGINAFGSCEEIAAAWVRFGKTDDDVKGLL